jgi:hypothetical protein
MPDPWMPKVVAVGGVPVDERMPEDLNDFEEPCPECGAPPGMPHDPGCPVAEEMGPDPDRAYDARVDREPRYEANGFDKFMDSTLIMEQKKKTVDADTVSPQRRLARNYQEHPLGKIRMGGRRG